jgi:hypothetical protein
MAWMGNCDSWLCACTQSKSSHACIQFKICFDHGLAVLNYNPYIFQVIGMLFIVNFMAPPFQNVCETCHVMDIIISPIGDVHCNAYCSKWKV